MIKKVFVALIFCGLCLVTQPAETAEWYDSDWGYRNEITIDYTKVSTSDLSYFPVLINTTDVSWKDTSNGGYVGQSDGGDILFTSSDGVTKLDHEIEKYTNTTGELIAWVEVPTVSASINTVIYMYCGNTSCADQWNINGTWNEGGTASIKLVQHLEESCASSDCRLDSTSNANNGTPYSSTTITDLHTTSGKIEGADSFDGSDDYVNIPNSTSLDITSKTLTLSAWIYLTSLSDYRTIIAKPVSASSHANPYYSYSLVVMKTGGFQAQKVQFGMATNASTFLGVHSSSTLSTGTWYYVAATYDGTDIEIYINASGGIAGYTSVNILSYDTPVRIGTNGAKTEVFAGTIDEARIYNRALGAGEITTIYNNQSSPSTFYSVGAIAAPPTRPAWYDCCSWGYRKKITIDHSKVSTSDLSYFPVLINTTDASWKDVSNGGHVGQSDGGDILFTSSDGVTKLDHEIEKYTNTTGELVAWVEVPTVSASTDTVIYIYYGDAVCADQWSINGTWDEGGTASFYMVQHMKDTTTSTTSDSTSNGNNGTKVAANEPVEADGKIGKGQSFDGSNDYVLVSDSTTLDVVSNFSYSCWIKPTSVSSPQYQCILKKSNTYWSSLRRAWSLYLNYDEEETSWYNAAWRTFTTTTANLSAGNWHFVTYARGSTNEEFYLNGSSKLQSAIVYAMLANDDPFIMGLASTNGSDTEKYTGILDEVRVYGRALGDAEVVTLYNNQSSPSTFYGIGREETNGDFFLLFD